MATLGSTERDGGGDGDAVGDTEQGSEVVLDEGVPDRHHAAVPERPGGEEEVLAGRVDRGSLGRVRRPVADEAGEDDDRDRLEVVDERRHGRACRALGASGSVPDPVS